MMKNRIEDILFRFVEKEFDILVLIIIIEIGVDILNINIFIIYDVDYLGFV